MRMRRPTRRKTGSLSSSSSSRICRLIADCDTCSLWPAAVNEPVSAMARMISSCRRSTRQALRHRANIYDEDGFNTNLSVRDGSMRAHRGKLSAARMRHERYIGMLIGPGGPLRTKTRVAARTTRGIRAAWRRSAQSLRRRGDPCRRSSWQSARVPESRSGYGDARDSRRQRPFLPLYTTSRVLATSR